MAMKKRSSGYAVGVLGDWDFCVSRALLLGSVYAFGRWQGGVNSDLAKFNEFMGYVRGRIDDIFDRLPNPLTGSTSPLSLTDLGKQISNEIGAAQWAARNLADAKQGTKGKTPCEVQQYCFDLAKLENLSGEEKRKVEDAAFKQGLTVSQILDVLGIELRDLLLTPNQLGDLP